MEDVLTDWISAALEIFLHLTPSSLNIVEK